MRLRTLIFIASAGLIMAGPGWGAESAPQPVLDQDFPDPFVLPMGEELVAYATNGQHLNVRFSRSIDGVYWSNPVDAMPVLPAWVHAEGPDIWAPEVMRVGQTYVMYFTGRHKSLTRPDGLTLCVGAATSDTPSGPFTPAAEPLTCGEGMGAIDPSPFRDGDNLWLYIKTDGNCCGTPISIIAQKLSADGTILVGAPVHVAGLTNDKPWEGAVIEGEQMIRHDGRYYMFFAANDYGSDKYATGYATCASPLGPCRDAEENPILKSEPDLVGPGHQSVFTFRGKTYIAYHAWRQTEDGKKRYRAMYISQVRWAGHEIRIDPRP